MAAYTNLAVTITPEIIEQSTQRNSGHCMIAEAIRAAVPGLQAISVDLQTIRFTDRELRTRLVYLTPRQAQRALIHFDQGEPVEPFTIKLRNPHYVPITQRAKKRDPDSKPGPTTPESGRKPATVSGGGKGGGRPRRQGGAAPPTAALVHRSGQRREYGLKTLPR